jgi:hypothetical protein
LPKELQLGIWKNAILEEPSQRIVELTFQRGLRRVVSLSLPPPYLSLTPESRAEALRYFKRLQQPLTDPPIYIDLEHDVCFIREDAEGNLSDQNLLLESIFGNATQPPACNLLGMKKLFVDYWVMERGWANLAPLQKLRGLDTFWIVMSNNAPQRALNPANETRTRVSSYNRKPLTDMYYVGDLDHHVRNAVERYWGIHRLQGHNLAGDIIDTMNFNVFAEMAQLVQADPTWVVPTYLLMTYGPY